MEFNTQVWVIHAAGGSLGHLAEKVNELFLDKGYIAVGWYELGDIRPYLHDLEQIQKRFLAYGTPLINASQGAGMLFKFANTVQPGDLVVFRPAASPKVHLGLVKGDYEYNPAYITEYPHLRKVEWRHTLDYDKDLSRETRNSFKSARSFFEPDRRAAREFRHLFIKQEK